MREGLRLVWMAFVVVLLFFGPQLTDLAVRALSVAQADDAAQGALEAGDTARLRGALDLSMLRRCPPGWLDLGYGGNQRERAFAPLVRDGSVAGWIALPGGALEGTAEERPKPEDLVDPLVWKGLQGTSSLGDDGAHTVARQVKYCPGGAGTVPDAETLELGELVDVRGGGSWSIASEVPGLVGIVGLSWGCASLGLLGLVWVRRRRGSAHAEAGQRWGALRARPLAVAWRVCVCVVVLGGSLLVSRGVGGVWERAQLPDSIEAPEDGQPPEEGFGSSGGIALASDVLLCTVVDAEQAGEGARLVVPVRSAASAPPERVMIVPYRGPRGALEAQLAERDSVLVHGVGYLRGRRLLSEALVGLKPCRPLRDGGVGGGVVGVVDGRRPVSVFEVDPRPPSSYATELVGLIALALQLGLIVGLLWAALTVRAAGAHPTQGERRTPR